MHPKCKYKETEYELIQIVLRRAEGSLAYSERKPIRAIRDQLFNCRGVYDECLIDCPLELVRP